MQTTLILLKPDCITKRKCGEVLRRFESEGFQILGCKMMELDRTLLKEHYAHIADRPFYPEVENFMHMTPVIAMALTGDDAIERVRRLLGPTDSRQADPGTIRGDLGVNQMLNVVHASDSEATAAVELKRFFKEEELFQYDMTPPEGV